MPSNIEIINLGLGKYSQTQIKRIDPAQTPIEVYCAPKYPIWRQTELSKRRWVFATIFNYALTASNYDEEAEYPYTFPLPEDCMRPLREKRSTWVQSKRNILSKDDTLTLDFIRNVDENEFDPLFVNVLACAIAFETVAFVTESRAKKADLVLEYKEAVDVAAKANAFVIGPEDINGDDSAYPFLSSRWQ